MKVTKRPQSAHFYTEGNFILCGKGKKTPTTAVVFIGNICNFGIKQLEELL